MQDSVLEAFTDDKVRTLERYVKHNDINVNRPMLDFEEVFSDTKQ